MNLVLGVSGSVAAYRAADLARELMRSGFTVRACLTDSAQKFVSPALFEALTGQPCLIDTFEEPERGRMAHIDWARSAGVVLVAPATANTLNKLAAGLGDDMLTTLVLASDRPLLVAPAMNPSMYADASTQAALQILRERGATVVEPTEGDVACGENGQGKLASIGAIVEAAVEASIQANLLAGKAILITSGPTREPIDDVRYLSNRSSGRMGAALAQAALQLGAARVVVVAGPGPATYPPRAELIRVETADQMLKACRAVAGQADWIVGAAAVADYRPGTYSKGKIRRSAEAMQVELVPNPDVIATLAAENPRAKVVGFAAEPSADLGEARAKLARKGLHAIVHNDVSDPSIGFDSTQNQVTLVTADVEKTSGIASKLRCALWIWENLAAGTI